MERGSDRTGPEWLLSEVADAAGDVIVPPVSAVSSPILQCSNHALEVVPLTSEKNGGIFPLLFKVLSSEN